MTATCPVCLCEQAEGLLCKTEVMMLRADLKAIPALVEDLAISISKQSRLTVGGRGSKGSTHERWPIDIDASAVAWALEEALMRWAKEIGRITQRPAPNAATNSASLLNEEMPTVRSYEHVADLIGQIHSAVEAAHEHVLGPRERTRIKVGPCPELNRDGSHCEGVVVAYIPRQDNAPSRMQCRADKEHRWTSVQFYRTGKRIHDRAEHLRRSA